MALGTAITGTAFLYMALVFRSNTPYFPWVLVGQVAQAGGIGLAISPATTAIMVTVPVEKAGVGSAMNDTNRQLGGALGVAVFGTIATRIYLNGLQGLRGLLPAEVFGRVAAGLPTAVSPETQNLVAAGLRPQVLQTAREAFMAGLRQSFLAGALIMYGASLFALLVLPNVVARRRPRRRRCPPKPGTISAPRSRARRGSRRAACRPRAGCT